MNIKILLLTLATLSLISTTTAEVVKREFHYDIAQSIGNDSKGNLVNLYYREKDGSITYISLRSDKLAAYLKTLTSPTVTLSIDHDERHRSIEFIKIDKIKWNSLENSGHFWSGKIPKFPAT